GVCGMAPPGRCQPAFAEKVSILPAVVLGNAIGVPLRVVRWTGEWSRRDPADGHWHLGPVAGAPALQGKGSGSAMMALFAPRVGCGEGEIDKAEYGRSYEGFG